MTFEYHLASRGANPARYVRIVGTAAAPVVEANVVINATDTYNNSYALFSTDNGETLWFGGQHGAGVVANALGVHRSVDNGATWENRSAALPIATGWQTVNAIAGFQGNPSVAMGMGCSSCQASWNKLNVGTDLFESKENTGGRPDTLWACEFSGRMYGIEGYTSGAPWLYYSDDQGETWTRDATYPVTGMALNYHVVTDPRNGRIYTSYPSSGAQAQWADDVGGPWTNELILAGGSISNLNGRWLCCDETGAVWAMCLYTGILKIVRRDPGTGTWTVSLTGAAGDQGALWVIDSQNILVSGSNGVLYFWDGSTWHAHTHVALGLSGTAYSAIWAKPAVACANNIVVPTDPIIEADFTINNQKRLASEFQTEAGCRTFVVPFSYNTPGRIFRNRQTPPSSSGNSCVMPHTVVKTKREKEEK